MNQEEVPKDNLDPSTFLDGVQTTSFRVDVSSRSVFLRSRVTSGWHHSWDNYISFGSTGTPVRKQVEVQFVPRDLLNLVPTVRMVAPPLGPRSRQTKDFSHKSWSRTICILVGSCDPDLCPNVTETPRWREPALINVPCPRPSSHQTLVQTVCLLCGRSIRFIFLRSRVSRKSRNFFFRLFEVFTGVYFKETTNKSGSGGFLMYLYNYRDTYIPISQRKNSENPFYFYCINLILKVFQVFPL